MSSESELTAFRNALSRLGLVPNEDLEKALEILKDSPQDEDFRRRLEMAMQIVELTNDKSEGIPDPGGSEESITSEIAVADGNVPAGTRSVCFAKIGSTGDIQVDGIPLSDLRPRKITSALGNTLPQINYTVQNGASMEVIYLTE